MGGYFYLCVRESFTICRINFKKLEAPLFQNDHMDRCYGMHEELSARCITCELVFYLFLKIRRNGSPRCLCTSRNEYFLNTKVQQKAVRLMRTPSGRGRDLEGVETPFPGHPWQLPDFLPLPDCAPGGDRRLSGASAAISALQSLFFLFQMFPYFVSRVPLNTWRWLLIGGRSLTQGFREGWPWP